MPATHFPQTAVGAIVKRQGKVLLIRRGQAPSAGLWAFPGGRIEPGETLQQAAEREVLEETGVRIKAGAVAYVFDMIERDEQGQLRFHYVVVDLLADYLAGEPRACSDADEAAWVPLATLTDLPLTDSMRRMLQEIDLTAL